VTAPKLSVVVPSHGGADRLPVLFSALRAQTFEGAWELVVVLDGVVDDSVDVVDAVDDLPVRVVELPENRGRPAALNAGFREATGDVLIRCDDDLGVAPTFLSRHAAAHTGVEPIGVVGLCHDVLENSAYARCYGRPANRRLREAAYRLPPAHWWKYWAANCSVTRATFERVGGYDTAFRTYGWEDVDWGYRLHLLGVPVILDPHLEVLHLAASSSAAIRVRRAFLGGRARARFDRKHGVEPARPEAVGPAQRAWRAAVEAVARTGSEEHFEARARALDRRLEAVPDAVAARAVAILVEAAALAGHASGTDRD
jgi:GT2 family glycosyltransferase